MIDIKEYIAVLKQHRLNIYEELNHYDQSLEDNETVISDLRADIESADNELSKCIELSLLLDMYNEYSCEFVLQVKYDKNSKMFSLYAGYPNQTGSSLIMCGYIILVEIVVRSLFKGLDLNNL